MATPTLQSNNTSSDSIIAGYFQNGEDAHRAINDLLDEGFLASQIGAAFHTAGGAALGHGSSQDQSQEATGQGFNEEAADVDTSAGGPSSGTDAVQPVGLASGTGSPILGAGKPGPISGSSLEHTGLSSELQSGLPHDEPGSTGYSAAPAVSHAPAAPSSVKPADSSWTAKLKHLFQSKSEDSPAAGSNATKESQNFGSGSGHLPLTAPYGLPYSPSAFETSVSGAGVPAEDSRQLSRRLSSGGAVVTVSATGRAGEVEKIFERHNGVVRFASDILSETALLEYEPRVEVFGHLEHRYLP